MDHQEFKTKLENRIENAYKMTLSKVANMLESEVYIAIHDTEKVGAICGAAMKQGERDSYFVTDALLLHVMNLGVWKDLFPLLIPHIFAGGMGSEPFWAEIIEFGDPACFEMASTLFFVECEDQAKHKAMLTLLFQTLGSKKRREMDRTDEMRTQMETL